MIMTGIIPYYKRNFLTHWNDVNELFDQFFNSAWVPYVNPGLRCDVKEVDKGYEIQVDLPGVKKEDIDVQLENGFLTIAVKQEGQKDQKEDNGAYIVKERMYEGCQRSFKLNGRVTKDDVKAAFSDGVLTITVAKKGDEPEDTKIAVQ